MLQWIYFNDEKQSANEMLMAILDSAQVDRAAMTDTNMDDLEAEIAGKPFMTYIKMYALADRLDIPRLRQDSVDWIVGETYSDQFTLEDLIQATEMVYGVTPDTRDHQLRKVVVYAAQCCKKQLFKLDRFKTLMQANVSFGFDFATKYAHRNYVYCPNCHEDIDLRECTCGMNGLCGYRLCSSQSWAELRCTSCGRTGHLRRERGQSMEAEEDIGSKAVKAVSVVGAKATPVVTRKRKNTH